MRYETWIKDWKTALSENFFLKIVTLLLLIGLILNATFLKKVDKIIVVPPTLTKEFWIEKNKVSPEYLEQMGVFFATLGGNLAPSNAEYNIKILTDYISHKRYADTKLELTSQAYYLRKNNITQAFFPVTVQVDRDNNTVKVEGDVIRNIGTTKISQEKMVFNMKFDVDNYKLYLDEFYVDYPERDKTRLKAKEGLGEDTEQKDKN